MEEINQEKSRDTKRLYRSQSNRFIGGVAGGLGEYFNTDPNVFRILFVVFTFAGGLGLLLYLAALIIVPQNPVRESSTETSGANRTTFWALLFIVLGVLLLMRQWGIFGYFHFWHIPWSSIWAFFLIGIGVLLIFSKRKQTRIDPETGEVIEVENHFSLYRSRKYRMLAGVCGGLAENFNIDPSIVRILWVLASITSVGLGILIYIILIFIFPEKDDTQTANRTDS
ncbi:MAG: PspC domain-containing protein [Calditrichia bacterium]